MQRARSEQKAPNKTVVVAGDVVVNRHIFQGRPTSPRARQGRARGSNRRITVRIGIWDGASEDEGHIARAAPVGLAEERGEPTLGSPSRKAISTRAGWPGVMARCCADRRVTRVARRPVRRALHQGRGKPIRRYAAQLTLARSRNFPMYGVIAVAYSVEM
jgi:hypothetical protein